MVDSIVDHLGSVTLKMERDQTDLTWAQMDIFIKKYYVATGCRTIRST